jgi:membrane associated rhomboid family serine protease
MKALAQLPYPIVFALTVGLFMGIAVLLTEPIWAAVLSLVVGCSLAYFLAQIILRRRNLPPNTTVGQYFTAMAARRSDPPS